MLVFLIAALTADGFIAKSDHHPATWTSPEDKQFFITKTTQAGVVIMGRKTYSTIGRPLKGRLNIIYTNSPTSVPNSQPLLNSLSEFSPATPYTTSLSPKQLIQKLKTKDYKLIAIIGGSSIYTLFLKSGVVTKLYLTLEPTLFGQGVTLFNEPLDFNLKFIKIHKLSPQTLVLEYSVVKQNH